MDNNKIYKAAMAKITPSEAWQKDTLEKLAAAQAEASITLEPEKAQADQKASPSKTVKLWKQMGLPLAAAAVFALLLVPAVRHFSSADTHLMEVIDTSNGLQSTAPEGAVSYDTVTGAKPERAVVSKAAPETYNGLPVIHWFKEISGRGGTWEFLARSPEDLVTQNPTFNLPTEQLPKKLPVWNAPAGDSSAPLLRRLQTTATHTGLTLVMPDPEPCPDGYPVPELWPCYYAGKLMDPDTYRPDLPIWEQLEPSVWDISASLQSVTLTNSSSSYSDLRAPSSEQMTRIGCEMAYNQLGSLVGINRPAYQSYSSVNYWGESIFESYQNFLYEAGHPSDPLEVQLMNYSFRRVYGSLSPGGSLDSVMLTFPPESSPLGYYPIRSLEDAKAALDKTLEEDRARSLIDYDISSDDIVNWRIEYYRSPMNAYILPLYVFNLKTPLQPSQTPYRFEGVSLNTVYVEYWVSALPDEYCRESLETRY